jgi:ABC-type transport system substrate-binding protein
MVCVGLNRAFCASVLLALLGWGELYAEETLSIGVEQFSDKLDLLDDMHPAAVLLRAGIGEGLVSLRRRSDGAPTKGQFELAIADSVNINADFSRWSFRIRPGARFQSGRPISSEDVAFSLQRCESAGALAGVKKSVSRRSKTPYDAVDEWVDLEVAPDLRGTLARDLARCSIWVRGPT